MFTSTKTFILTAISLAFTVLILAVCAIPNQSAPVDGPYGAAEYKRNVVSATASCGGIFLTKDIDEKFYGTIPAKYADTDLNIIPTQFVQIPTYGFMVNEPTDPKVVKFYDKSFDNVFPMPVIYRMMWDGYNIIWYDPILTPNNELKDLKTYADKLNKDAPTTVVLPFNLPDRKIPFTKNFAFSSWGASQSCGTFSEDAYTQFVSFSQENAPAHSGTPQVAPLSPDGLFYAPRPEAAAK